MRLPCNRTRHRYYYYKKTVFLKVIGLAHDPGPKHTQVWFGAANPLNSADPSLIYIESIANYSHLVPIFLINLGSSYIPVQSYSLHDGKAKVSVSRFKVMHGF